MMEALDGDNDEVRAARWSCAVETAVLSCLHVFSRLYLDF